MIPKILHYCWFGGNPKPESFYICLNSWKKVLPDYKIMEWNESNFDVNCCEYVKLAAENNKWAFVSDYSRALALFEHGGIYLDIDVEIKLSLDEFLIHRAFSGFEIKGSPFTALWGTEKGHPWAKRVVDFYNEKTSFDLTTNTVFVSDLLVNEYGIDPNKDEYQEGKDGIVIYPSTYFCLDLPKNYASHHFIGTWHQRDFPNPYKDYIHAYYKAKELSEIKNGKAEIHNVLNNMKMMSINDILDQIPLKSICKYLINKIFK